MRQQVALGFLICLAFECLSVVKASTGIQVNLTNFIEHRSKRSLIFEGGGTIKVLVGPALMVPLADPIQWRSVVCGLTLQGGHYTLPNEPLYPWDKYENIFARSIGKVSKMQENSAFNTNEVKRRVESDDSRLFVYVLIETLLEKLNNGHGRICLLRSICENARGHMHVGVFSEIMNIILTPGKEDIDAVYVDAYNAGRAGADCLSLYHQCPRGKNILDQYLEEW